MKSVESQRDNNSNNIELIKEFRHCIVLLLLFLNDSKTRL